MFIDGLIEQALTKAPRRRVKDVRAGLGYTCALLEDDACELAYTFNGELTNVIGFAIQNRMTVNDLLVARDPSDADGFPSGLPPHQGGRDRRQGDEKIKQ